MQSALELIERYTAEKFPPDLFQTKLMALAKLLFDLPLGCDNVSWHIDNLSPIACCVMGQHAAAGRIMLMEHPEEPEVVLVERSEGLNEWYANALKPDDEPANPEQQMEELVRIVGDDVAVQVLAIASRKGPSANRKMEEIISLDIRFAGKNCVEWGSLLGVSSAAIRVCPRWVTLQKAKKSLD